MKINKHNSITDNKRQITLSIDVLITSANTNDL